jgi:hypothetical protein
MQDDVFLSFCGLRLNLTPYPPPPTFTDMLSIYLPQRGRERERGKGGSQYSCVS